MRRHKVLLVLLVAILLAGCAATATLSLKGKAAMILATYNVQTQQVVDMSNRPDLAEAQKDIVRKKKAIIQKLDPMIKAYGILVQQGGTPSPDIEQAIYDLIDALVAQTQ